MARLPRLCSPGIAQHIIQRGNNRGAYAHWLAECSQRFRVAIHAWVFMTNHVHLLVTPETDDGVSQMMQTLGRHYVRYFNHTYRRTGTLWEGRFKSCVVDAENYVLLCQRYIELNPVRAGMVTDPADYPWSSYRANGLGQAIMLWTPHPTYNSLGEISSDRASAYRALFTGQLEPGIIDRIRQATNQGMALGNDKFKEDVERLTQRRVRPLKRGPKTKQQTADV